MLPRTFIEVTLTYVFTTFAAAHFCSRSFANSAMVPEVLCVAHNKLLTLFLCDLSSYPPPLAVTLTPSSLQAPKLGHARAGGPCTSQCVGECRR